MKPELEWSARRLGEAAQWTADETLAAIEGFIEGWSRGPELLNINSASVRQLETLPGISADDAHRIARQRPYHDKRELAKRGIISEYGYARIKDRISAD